MTTSDILLVAVAVLVILSAARSEWRYKRLVRMFADLATMTGDAFDELIGGSDDNR